MPSKSDIQFAGLHGFNDATRSGKVIALHDPRIRDAYIEGIRDAIKEIVKDRLLGLRDD